MSEAAEKHHVSFAKAAREAVANTWGLEVRGHTDRDRREAMMREKGDTAVQYGILHVLLDILAEQHKHTELLREVAMPYVRNRRIAEDKGRQAARQARNQYIAALEAEHGRCPAALRKAIRESISCRWQRESLKVSSHNMSDPFAYIDHSPQGDPTAIDTSLVGNWKAGTKRQQLWEQWIAHRQPKTKAALKQRKDGEA